MFSPSFDKMCTFLFWHRSDIVLMDSKLSGNLIHVELSASVLNDLLCT